jgi:CheY-like chemotaxis protein
MSLGVCIGRASSAVPSLETDREAPASSPPSDLPSIGQTGQGDSGTTHGAAARREKTAEIPAKLPRGNNELILVVEDESPVLNVVRATLQKFGYRVLTAGNGAEALSLFKIDHAAIAAVFTDLAMPVMDGPTMAAALRTINPAVKIIASSGLAASFGCLEETMPGLSEFIPKPYTAETLLTVVARVLRGDPGPA